MKIQINNFDLRYFLPLVSVFFMSACSNEAIHSSAKIEIQIPALRGLSLSSVPNSTSEFTCVALNVTGAGIEAAQGLGIVSTMVAASTGGTLTLEVPIGRQRLFQVIGLQSASGACPSEVDRASLLSTTAYPIISEVGRKVSDIQGDTTLTIVGSFQLSSAVDVRTGQALAGGGGGSDGDDGGDGDSGGGGGGGGSTTPPAGCSGTHTASFAGGNGSEGTPYLISSTGHWNYISNTGNLMKCYFKLTQNIDFAGATPVRIGTPDGGFMGHFDGDNFKIFNGVVPASATTAGVIGLFDKIRNGATVKDLTIEDFSITASVTTYVQAGVLTAEIDGATLNNILVKDVSLDITTSSTSGSTIGGVVGRMVGTAYLSNTVTEVHVENLNIALPLRSAIGGLAGAAGGYTSIAQSSAKNLTFTGTSSAPVYFRVGGIVGDSSAPIEDVLVSGFTINDPNSTDGSFYNSGYGGIVGLHSGETVRRAAAVGINFTVGVQAGGIVGVISSQAKVEDSHAAGTITATQKSGGAFAAVRCTISACVTRNYSAVTVTDSGSSNRFGFVGYILAADRVEQSYWDTTVGGASGGAVSSDLTGLATAAMQDSGSYTGWNFTAGTGTWTINSNEYPKLRTLGAY